MNDVIFFENVSKQFKKNSVLSDISFSVEAGEYFGLVGLNGAGKSTLIKCLLDFCSIDNGKINIHGINHTRTESREKLVYLPEKFTPPYYLTGSDFLKFMSELHGNSYSEIEINKMLGILDLDKLALTKSVRQFSKGMSQKLGLISSLMSKKKTLIFDEPMTGLDPRAMTYLKNHLLDIKQTGYTLFFSSHLLSDIESLCDRMAILHGGKICFVGSPQQCKDTYKSDNIESAFINCVNNLSVS